MVVVRADRLTTRENSIVVSKLHHGDFEVKWVQFLREGELDKLGVAQPVATFRHSATKTRSEVQVVTLTEHLGSGQYCDAYRVNVFETDCVVKVYMDEQKAKDERGVCDAVKHVQHVAHLARHQPDEQTLVAIAQVGLHFDKKRKITLAHVKQLHEALASFHQTGYVHGDICASNIYYVSATEALLNDWSHAFKPKESELHKYQDADQHSLAETVRNLAPDSIELFMWLMEEQRNKISKELM